jgi:holo-[acyl-carrier protein] synthase
VISTATTMSGASVDRMAMSLRAATLEQMHRALSADGYGADPMAVTPSDSLRVGMDLVPVADVAASVDRLGRRYLYRVFTPHERACARLSNGGEPLPATGSADGDTGRVDRLSTAYSMQSLAGRFAAKEAAVKVLRPREARPEWRSIEVHRVDGGWCELRLSGLAARLAAEAGLTTLAVSVTHEPMMAAACVVAMSRGDATVRHRKSPPEQKGP